MGRPTISPLIDSHSAFTVRSSILFFKIARLIRLLTQTQKSSSSRTGSFPHLAQLPSSTFHDRQVVHHAVKAEQFISTSKRSHSRPVNLVRSGTFVNRVSVLGNYFLQFPISGSQYTTNHAQRARECRSEGSTWKVLSDGGIS